MKIFLKTPIIPFVIGLIAGLYFISFQVIGYRFEFFPGDLIDGRFNNYILEHCYKFFTFQISDFWNAPFIFPEKNVITYSDNLLGTAPFYSLFRILGSDRETAFQLWFLVISILNYSSAFLLIKYIFKNNYSAASGAFVFAFSLALQSQMGHAQTFTRFPMALAILCTLKFAENFQSKWFFATVFCLTYQFYCGMYLGFILLFPLAVLLLVYFVSKRKILLPNLKDKKWLFKITASIVINLLLLLPLLIPYFQRAKQLGFYPYEQIVKSLPTPLSYFFSWKGSLFWDSLCEVGLSYPAFWDHMIFAGACAVIGILFFVVVLPFKFFGRRSLDSETTNMKLLWITAIITFLIFIRVNETSFYRILFNVPGYGSMRALQRIINFELIFFAISFAYLINLLTKKNNLISFSIFCVLIIFTVADNYVKAGFVHQHSKSESQLRIDELAEKMKSIPKDKIVSYEPDSLTSSASDYHLDAMLAAQLFGLKTLNGYSATSPGGFGDYWVKPDSVSRKTWLTTKNLSEKDIVVLK